MRTLSSHSMLGLMALQLCGCGADVYVVEDDTSAASLKEPATALSAEGEDLAIGSSGVEVAAVNRYLTEFGYLPNPELAQSYPEWRSPVAEAPARADLFDEATAAGVERLQSNFGLLPTSVVDSTTRALMRAARCAVPDNIENIDKYRSESSWGTVSTLKWRLANGPPQSPPHAANFTQTQAEAMVASALAMWGGPMRYAFQKVPAGSGEHIVVAFANVFSAGCPKAGKTVGGEGAIAMASLPQPGGTACAFFRTDVTWRDAGADHVNTFDFKRALAHELGHTLGLGHSGWENTVMYPAYAGPAAATTDDRVGAYVVGVHWGEISGGGAENEDLDMSKANLLAALWALRLPALGNDLSLWKRDPFLGWQNLSTTGIGAKRVAAGTSGAWLVQDDGDVFRYDGSWNPIPGECGTDIAVGPDDSVWMLGCSANLQGNHNIYKWNGSDFIKDSAAGAQAIRISVGRRLDFLLDSNAANDNVMVPWIVKSVSPFFGVAGEVYRRDSNGTGSGTHWSLVPFEGPFIATDVSANAAGYTWFTSNTPANGGSRLLVMNEQASAPAGVPPPSAISHIEMVGSGAAKWITSTNSGVPYVVNDEHTMFTAD